MLNLQLSGYAEATKTIRSEETMKNELYQREKELYRRTDEILHYIWDPIGIKDVPQARDEYHAYFPRVFARVLENYSDDEIADYLIKVESEEMGLTTDRKRALEVAKILTETKNWILDEVS